MGSSNGKRIDYGKLIANRLINIVRCRCFAEHDRELLAQPFDYEQHLKLVTNVNTVYEYKVCVTAYSGFKMITSHRDTLLTLLCKTEKYELVDQLLNMTGCDVNYGDERCDKALDILYRQPMIDINWSFLMERTPDMDFATYVKLPKNIVFKLTTKIISMDGIAGGPGEMIQKMIGRGEIGNLISYISKHAKDGDPWNYLFGVVCTTQNIPEQAVLVFAKKVTVDFFQAFNIRKFGENTMFIKKRGLLSFYEIAKLQRWNLVLEHYNSVFANNISNLTSICTQVSNIVVSYAKR